MLFRNSLPLPKPAPEISLSLARLSGLDGLARSLMIGVIPLIALNAFGSKEVISTVYFISSIFSLIFTLNINRLEKLFNRRRLLFIGGFFLIFAVVFFYLQNAVFFALGIGLRAAGASIFTVCMSLFIMDNIQKKEFTRTESTRLWYVGLAWAIGPFTGVWLYENAPEMVIYVAAILATVGMLIYFRRMQMDNANRPKEKKTTKKTAVTPTINPIQATAKFFSQPLLRKSYFITLTRSCYWIALFIYGPIYVVEAGLPPWIGGALLSIVSSLLLFSPFIRRLADKFGTRQVIIVCLVFIGINMIALGLLRETRPIGVLIFLLSSIGGICVDVITHIPFMRFVRPSQRTEMTMVYTTWRETANLLTQAIIFLTLLVAPFWVFFIILGILQFIAAYYASFLPRRM